MAIIPGCIIKTERLVDGESFVLPPGAVLIGADIPGNFTSTCVIPTLETLQCFGLTLGARSSDSDGHAEYFERDQQRIYGYFLNDIYNPFASFIVNSGSLGAFNMSDLSNRLAAAIPGIIGAAVNYSSDPDNGTRSNLVIKTFPSIALNLRINVATNANFGTQTDVYYRSSFTPLADLIAGGYTDYPPCP